MSDKIDRRELMAVTAGAGLVALASAEVSGDTLVSATTPQADGWVEIGKTLATHGQDFIDMLKDSDPLYAAMVQNNQKDDLQNWYDAKVAPRTAEIHAYYENNKVLYGFSVSYEGKANGQKRDVEFGPTGWSKQLSSWTDPMVITNTVDEMYARFCGVLLPTKRCEIFVASIPAGTDSSLVALYSYFRKGAKKPKGRLMRKVKGGRYRNHIDIDDR